MRAGELPGSGFALGQSELGQGEDSRSVPGQRVPGVKGGCGVRWGNGERLSWSSAPYASPSEPGPSSLGGKQARQAWSALPSAARKLTPLNWRFAGVKIKADRSGARKQNFSQFGFHRELGMESSSFEC